MSMGASTLSFYAQLRQSNKRVYVNNVYGKPFKHRGVECTPWHLPHGRYGGLPSATMPTPSYSSMVYL